MLDYEPLALQCSLLSAQASGLTSVQDHRCHAGAIPSSRPEPSTDLVQQGATADVVEQRPQYTHTQQQVTPSCRHVSATPTWQNPHGI